MMKFPFYDKNTGLTFLDKTNAQGDVDWVPIAEIPADAIPVKPENGAYILAHSETGHHHVLDRVEGVTYYEAANDPFSGFLEVVGAPVTLKHMRSHDTHLPHTISPGKYYISRGREWTPAGLRPVQD